MNDQRIQHLAEQVMAKILAKRQMIAEAEGKITIEVFPKGPGFDIKINVTA